MWSWQTIWLFHGRSSLTTEGNTIGSRVKGPVEWGAQSQLGSVASNGHEKQRESRSCGAGWNSSLWLEMLLGCFNALISALPSSLCARKEMRNWWRRFSFLLGVVTVQLSTLSLTHNHWKISHMTRREQQVNLLYFLALWTLNRSWLLFSSPLSLRKHVVAGKTTIHRRL